MKKRYLIILIVIVIIAAGTVFILTRPKKSNFEFATVERQNLVQEVNVTGKVKAAEAVDLAFEKGGRVVNIYVDTGSIIEAGNALLALDSSELQAQLNQAKAQLEVQEVALQKLQKGARAEEIDVLQTKVVNAQKAVSDAQTTLANAKTKASTDLTNLYDDVGDILQSAYASADDAVNKQTDDLFSNDLSDSPLLTFQVSNSQNKIAAEQQRVASKNALKELKTIVDNITSDYTILDSALSNAEQKLNTVRDFLTALTDALNLASDLSATTIATYKGYVNTGRTNVITAITNINTQKQAIATQKITNQQNIATAQAGLTSVQSTLDSAQKELELKQAPATPEQIQEQQAQIKAAQADIQNLEIQISKTVLRSPIKGVVTKQATKIGQIITANSAVVSIISEAKFQVEANVAEADIAKLKINDPAKITLDAYGSGVIFEAKVLKIDPAETIIEGIPTYKTTFEFSQESDKIKSGMTANIDILTAQKENVLVVPYRAVISKNGDKIVRVLNGKTISERKVQIGLRGSDGNVEITEGLKEGEKVITFEKK